jgi:hypothetical protein
MERQGRRLVLTLLVCAGAVGCDFQPDPVPGPVAVPATRFVSVSIQYRQPAGCANAPQHCGDRVVFFGSWMAAGSEVLLDTPTGPTFWTGVVSNVPVNWPPTDEPHYVRVFDPHLVDTPTGGVTAARLIVGGQAIDAYDAPGTPQESGLIYVDDSGTGRPPS